MAKTGAVAICLAIVFCVAAILYFEESPSPSPLRSGEQSILELGQPFQSARSASTSAEELAFSRAGFQHPDISFRPWIRWWWPGDAVTDEELKSEVARFDANGFGGFEIQSFARGLDTRSSSADHAAFLGFDTSSFYKHVQVALQAASQHKMQADLTIGSGYPTASQHILSQDNLLTLTYGFREILGPERLEERETPPSPPFWYKALSVAGKLAKRRMIDFDSAKAVPLAAVAYRVTGHTFRGDLLSIGWQPNLDASSAIDLSHNVASGGRVSWNCPPGRWAIITFYVMPSGTRPFPGPALKDPGLVLNFFDPARIDAMNNYLFGPRTGLPPYFRSPLRAVFADSFELQAERFVVPDILDVFKRERAYELTLHLGALPLPGQDNWYLDVAGVKRHAAFDLNDEDERVRYDYDLTISDLFITRYLGPSRQWASRHGLRQRVQPYGLNINILKAAGSSDIPETEVLYAGGAESFLKLVTSGAHLYGRNVVSAEAFDHPSMGIATTIPALKAEADRLFISGINSIVFHGSPYLMNVNGKTSEHWYPFRSSKPSFTISSNFDQTGDLWSKVKPLNDYIARCQYLLRLGKPKADVLVYYPFLGFPNDYATLSHHQEFGFNGFMPDLRSPGAHSPVPAILSPLFRATDLDKVQWLDTIWPDLQELESQGITWDWITDAELGRARACGQRVCIGNDSYSSIALIDIKALPTVTASKLHKLALDGGHVHLIGSSPSMQPGYKDFQRGDQIVKAEMRAIRAINSEPPGEETINLEREAIHSQILAIASSNPGVRRTERALPDHSSLTFLENQSEVAAELRINPISRSSRLTVLDAATGDVRRIFPTTGRTATFLLMAHQSIFITDSLLLAEGNRLFELKRN